jgi:hypothetical protein
MPDINPAFFIYLIPRPPGQLVFRVHHSDGWHQKPRLYIFLQNPCNQPVLYLTLYSKPHKNLNFRRSCHEEETNNGFLP